MSAEGHFLSFFSFLDLNTISPLPPQLNIVQEHGPQRKKTDPFVSLVTSAAPMRVLADWDLLKKVDRIAKAIYEYTYTTQT